MGCFTSIVHRIGMVGTAIGAGFLVGIMLLTVANIVYRLFGPVIVGSYELTELMIVFVAGFALVYGAIGQAHVVVRILVSRFSPRAQAIAESFAYLLGIGIWGVIAVSTAEFFLERGLADRTEILGLPFQPGRYFWVFALSVLSLVLLIDFCRALSRAIKK